MKFPAFDYVRAGDIGEALQHLSTHGEDARVLAGGQSLMPLLAMRLAAPAVLIDVNALGALDHVNREDDALRVGALVRHHRVASDAAIRAGAPLLAMAAPHVAHPGIRNRGTLGGSLAFADPSSEFPACALALDARITLRSSRGERQVPAEDFFEGAMTTALAPDELLTGLAMHPAREAERFAFEEVARRHGDYALAGVAVAARCEGERIAALRLAFFGVADRPILARAAAAILIEGAASGEAVEAAAAALGEDIDFADGIQASARLRRHLAGVVLRRALGRITARRAEDA